MAKMSVVDVTKALKGAEFPAEKDDLVQHAEENGADQDVVDFLSSLPDQEFESITDVMSAFGEAA